MLNHTEIEKTWARALRGHATAPLQGATGPYLAIGAKSLRLLDELWAASGTQEPLDVGALLAAGKDVRIFSDPHFEHANIIRMCERPFDAIEAMDEALWMGVSEAMEQADFVICLGDWAMKNPLGWAGKAFALGPDRLVSVVGNHDAKGAKPGQWAQVGARASLACTVEKELVRSLIAQSEPESGSSIPWDMIPARVHLGFAHWPVPPQRLPGPSWISFHGHIHNNPSRALRVNCSVEALGFKPRALSSLFTAQLMMDLAERQRGLGRFDESESLVAGDSDAL